MHSQLALSNEHSKPHDEWNRNYVLQALKLVIEIDGDTHSSQESKDYDLERSQRLEGYGLQVVRFTNEEVLADFEVVCLRIVAQMQRPHNHLCADINPWPSSVKGNEDLSLITVDSAIAQYPVKTIC